VQKVREKQKRR